MAEDLLIDVGVTEKKVAQQMARMEAQLKRQAANTERDFRRSN